MKIQFYFQKVSDAIEAIKKQPELVFHFEELSEKIGLESNEFETVLNNWAGISLNQFLNFISPNHNLGLIKPQNQSSLFDNSSTKTGIAFCEFTEIIPMTDAEFDGILSLNYDFYESPFGKMIIASSSKGVCYMAFEDEKDIAVKNLKSRFNKFELIQKKDDFQTSAISIFDFDHPKKIKLHMRGTDFQLKVWNELLKIQTGKLKTYQQIADEVGMPTAARAVGTAIGRNPVAYIVPCHRVVQSSGGFGGYMWGSNRKIAIIAFEMGKLLQT